jgi:large subunit ribosomal protein L5
MNFLDHLNKKILKYDLVNKFLYKNTKTIPKIEKIILNFVFKTSEIKHLSTGLLALKLITNQNGILTSAKHPHTILKIRKGNPIGCKITLRKSNLIKYYLKLIIEIFPKLKNFDGFKFSKKPNFNAFSLKLNDIFVFNELQNHYHLFNILSKLDVTIITNTQTKKELIFILNSFKLPFKRQM